MCYPWELKRGKVCKFVHFDETVAPNPPFIPEENPTGCYVRNFTLDRTGWIEKYLYILKEWNLSFGFGSME